MRALVLAFLLVAAPAFADRTATVYAEACGLTGTSSSVVADVYDKAAPTVLLATVPNGSMARVASTSDCYRFAISAASGISFPATGDATEKHYYVRFRDDANAAGVFTSVTVAGVVGAIGDVPESCKKPTKVYASSPIPARGLTSTLINEGMPSYIKVEVACDRDFTTPDSVYYLVRTYDSSGRDFTEYPSLTVPNP